MLFFGIKNIWFKTIVLTAFATLSALFVFLIYRNYYITDPYDPALTGTERYGHNGAGAFQRYTLLILIEFLVLAAVLVPYSFSRFYWVRPLILQILFFGWTLLMLVSGMHGGNVDALHTLYLLGINAVIFVLLAAAVIAEVVSRRTHQNNPNV